MVFTNILNRLKRLLRKDLEVFSELRRDESANVEALLIVVVTSVLAGLVALINGSNALSIVFTILSGIVISWLGWSWFTTLLLTNLYGVNAEFWQVARLLGYATLPMILVLAGLLGCLGSLVASLAWIGVLVAGVFAIREGYQLATEKAIIAVIVGWAAILVFNLLIKLVLPF
ncbi:MAG: hypothetical protein GXY52_01710 [Chloroflexi bacterium]|nr:hypothetical protein [Chloroflexota bacterium]